MMKLFLTILCLGVSISAFSQSQPVKGSFGSGAPSSSTPCSEIGQLYTDISAGVLYSAVTITRTPTSTSCTWAAGGGGGGLNANNTSNANALVVYTNNGGATTGKADTGAFTDGAGNFTTSGIGTFGSGSGNAGFIQLPGNTSNPSIGSNATGWLGPASASFTSYVGQFPSTAPAAHSVAIWPAPTSNVAAFNFKAIPDCQDSGGNHINFTQSTDAFSCGTSSSGGGFDPLDVTTIYLRDDFLGSSTNLSFSTSSDFGWSSYAITGSFTESKVAGAYPHIGIAALGGQSTSTGNGSGIAWGDGTNGHNLFNNISTHTFDSLFIVKGDTQVANEQISFGWKTVGNSFAVDGCYIKYDTTNSDTNWIARCRNSGTATDNSLGVAPSTSSWTKARISATTAGTIVFQVCNGDGCALPVNVGATGFICYNSGGTANPLGTGNCTTSANIPTAAMDLAIVVINANSVQSILDIDLVALKFTSTGR